MRNNPRCVTELINAGIERDDAWDMRRIAMTLHRWNEMECGDGNDFASWAIERGDDGKPRMCTYPHEGRKTSRIIPDREAGALKRLAKIMSHYPGWSAYHQTDCRGASLYVLRPGDMRKGDNVESCYNRGIAVYK
jgi:hypothetical protein